MGILHVKIAGVCLWRESCREEHGNFGDSLVLRLFWPVGNSQRVLDGAFTLKAVHLDKPEEWKVSSAA